MLISQVAVEEDIEMLDDKKKNNVKYFLSASSVRVVRCSEWVCVWTDGPLCVPMFSEEPYNDTSYNVTDPYGGESRPVRTAPLLSTFLVISNSNMAGKLTRKHSNAQIIHWLWLILNTFNLLPGQPNRCKNTLYGFMQKSW